MKEIEGSTQSWCNVTRPLVCSHTVVYRVFTVLSTGDAGLGVLLSLRGLFVPGHDKVTDRSSTRAISKRFRRDFRGQLLHPWAKCVNAKHQPRIVPSASQALRSVISRSSYHS